MYSDVSFDADAFRTMADNVSLFDGVGVHVVLGIGDVADLREAFEDIAETLVASPEVFILSENAVPAAFVKRMKAAGVEPEVFDKKAEKKADAFNSFALTDAFAAKNRSQTWALYRTAIGAGIEPRELHGKLFWAAKSMLLAKKSKTAEDVGIHPYAYGKAKASAQGFAEGELEKILTKLTVLVHESMLSGIDLETALEAFILKTLVRPSIKK